MFINLFIDSQTAKFILKYGYLLINTNDWSEEKQLLLNENTAIIHFIENDIKKSVCYSELIRKTYYEYNILGVSTCYFPKENNILCFHFIPTTGNQTILFNSYDIINSIVIPSVSQWTNDRKRKNTLCSD